MSDNNLETVLPALKEKTDKYLVKSWSREAGEKDHFRMSSLGLCHRRRMYERLGEAETNPNTFSQMKRMASGEWMHNFYYDLWEKSVDDVGVKILSKEEEVNIPEFQLKGHYDAKIGVDGHEILVDLKSQDPKAFYYYKKTGFTKKPWQEMQLGGYLMATGVTEGVIWLFEPVYFGEVLFPVFLTDELKAKIHKDMSKLLKEYEQKKLPEVDYNTSPQQGLWECKYCSFRDKCFAETPEHKVKYQKGDDK
jgi:CRISPR/Cas system-associated exonuclease Cas4 (RecB family)